MSAIMPLVRQLGDKLGCKPVQELTTITGPQRPTKPSVWSPEAWAQMQRIYATPDPTRDLDMEEI